MTSTITERQQQREPDALEINTLLGRLRLTHESVGDKEWLSPDLAGEPASSVSGLGSTTKPLSALDSAGMGFLTPMVSFLEEPLGQLRGNPDAVTSSSSDYDRAGQDATSVADQYRSTSNSETSQWSGKSASDYQKTGTNLADGIESIAETALTSAKAMIGAGEVVAQVVDIVTRLITEAVGKIVPIMSEAIAQAPATFGQSIAIAIPRCVQIAVDYAGQIAAKLGALLASGENLTKLIDGALGTLKIVKQVLAFIGQQSQSGSSTSTHKPSTLTGTQTLGTKNLTSDLDTDSPPSTGNLG